MDKDIRITFIFILTFFSTKVFAFGGVPVDPDQGAKLKSEIVVSGTPLPLQAAATRNELWVEVYRCGIYALDHDLLRSSLDQPIAVQFRILTNLLPEEPPVSWQSRLAEVISTDNYNRLENTFKGLEPDDKLKFVYSPKKGTSLSTDEDEVFVSPGRQLITAVIDMLIGSDPVSHDLKKELVENS